MHFFHIHPDDYRWLRRWVRSNLACFFLIAGFLLTIRLSTIDSNDAASCAHADRFSVALPQHEEIVVVPADHSEAVVPTGWRLTSDGWENVSSWSFPRRLGDIINSQLSREPVWMRLTLAKVRGVPPLAYATLQLILIALIVRVAAITRQRREDRQSNLTAIDR